MIKEYSDFFKRYFEVAKLKKKYFIFMFIIDIVYKAMLLLMILFASWIIKYATLGQIDMTWISLGLLFISYLIYTIFYYLSYKIYGKNNHYTFTTLQTLLFKSVMKADDRFTEKISKGKLLNSIIDDPIEIGDNCNQVAEIFATIVQIIFVFVIVSFCSVWLGILMFIYSIIHIKIRDWSVKNYLHYYRKERYQTDKYSSLLSQVLSGLQEIKTFDMLGKLNTKLDSIQTKFKKAFLIKRRYVTIGFNDIKFFIYAFRILLYIIVLIMMINKTATVDVLVLVIGYHESLIVYINRICEGLESIRNTDISVERTNQIFNYNNGQSLSYGFCTNDDIEGIIEFKNVTFGYKKKTILDNLSFSVKPHTITTIVGPSGTGKTSIINLLLRLYKPKSGEILVDGVDAFEYSREVYASNVAVVNQKPFVFNMSIRKNLSFIDNNFEHQIEACKKVGIHDFITNLPHGYDTILREDAANISGGQKQLISLARTLLSKSEILLFDEATSSLDTETAKQVVSVLKELKKGHTVLMITHKPEVMRRADRIIVINEGKIVGDGKHSDLINKNEHYQWLQSRNSVSKLGVFYND